MRVDRAREAALDALAERHAVVIQRIANVEAVYLRRRQNVTGEPGESFHPWRASLGFFFTNISKMHRNPVFEKANCSGNVRYTTK